MPNTIIKFVGEQGSNPASDVTSSTAQTGSLLPFVVVMLIGLVAAGFLVIRLYQNRFASNVGHATVGAFLSANSKKLMIAALVFVSAVVIACGAFLGAKTAQASQNELAKATDSVEAVVDASTGEVTIPQGQLEALTDDVRLIGVEVNLLDGAKDASDSIWQVTVDKTKAYDDVAGKKVRLQNQIPLSTQSISFAVSNLDAKIAKSLIGKEVASVSFDLFKPGPFVLRQVTFDPSNGIDASWSEGCPDGATLPNPGAPEHSPEGKTFDAWQLNGVNYDFTTPVTSDITLVAKYKASSQKENMVDKAKKESVDDDTSSYSEFFKAEDKEDSKFADEDGMDVADEEVQNIVTSLADGATSACLAILALIWL